MADVVIFDTETKRVKNFLRSVHTPDYKGKSDVLVFFKKPVDVPACPMKYWKVEKGKVVEMTDTEKAQVDAEKKEAEKTARIKATKTANSQLQSDIQYLLNNFTKQEIVQLAKEGDLAARLIVLKEMWQKATTQSEKIDILAKFQRLVEWRK